MKRINKGIIVAVVGLLTVATGSFVNFFAPNLIIGGLIIALGGILFLTGVYLVDSSESEIDIPDSNKTN